MEIDGRSGAKEGGGEDEPGAAGDGGGDCGAGGELGATLPEDYRRFLREVNAGCVGEDWAFDDVAPTYVYGVRSGEYGLGGALKTYCNPKRPRMPAEVIPIAEDGSGNAVCLTIRGKDKGAVWFWDHEEEAFDAPPGYENMVRLTASFGAFVSGLRPEGEERPARKKKSRRAGAKRGRGRSGGARAKRGAATSEIDALLQAAGLGGPVTEGELDEAAAAKALRGMMEGLAGILKARNQASRGEG